MDVGRRRSTGGSVWENRMKIDEVKGGFKVFNGGNNNTTEETRKISNNNTKNSPVGTSKRKTWKSDTNPIQIARGKSEEHHQQPTQPKRVLRSHDKTPIKLPKPIEIRSEETQDLDLCQDKAISSTVIVELESITKSDDLDLDHEIGVVDQEIEDIKETQEIEVDESEDIKETQETKPKEINVNSDKVVVSEVKKLDFEKNSIIIKNNNIKVAHRKQPEPISLNVKRQSPVIQRATKFSHSTAASDEFHSFTETHGRLQSFVDLVMWKDISRSVFIFGIGSFTILSSSYTKDLNISFIAVISYLGLVYLAAIFLFRSIVCRGAINMDNTSYVLGQEEAIWLLKIVLPYLNEFLLKLKALFSGDPSTTMKMAVLLFILARCGSSITIWTMAKLGFFGVFTVPKVCSLYSTQIYAYAKFWGRRFRDAWDTCSHKKGMTIAVFMLVWNLSSIVARIWAVFMLFVAFRYYQQSLVTDNWVDTEGEESWYEPIGVQKQGPASTIIDHTKPKKIS